MSQTGLEPNWQSGMLDRYSALPELQPCDQTQLSLPVTFCKPVPWQAAAVEARWSHAVCLQAALTQEHHPNPVPVVLQPPTRQAPHLGPQFSLCCCRVGRRQTPWLRRAPRPTHSGTCPCAWMCSCRPAAAGAPPAAGPMRLWGWGCSPLHCPAPAPLLPGAPAPRPASEGAAAAVLVPELSRVVSVALQLDLVHLLPASRGTDCTGGAGRSVLPL